MGRAYPPVWCEKNDCSKCDIRTCHKKTLALFEPYKYDEINFEKRPKTVEVTSIATYFGYCQRLAKFFLLFPQRGPIDVVKNNFFNSTTGLPTNVSIQRIFLDMLNHGDPNAPTDNIHKYRLIFLTEKTKSEKEGIIYSNGSKILINISDEERKRFMKLANDWLHNLFQGNVSFKKTENTKLCEYCFLENCEPL